MHDGYWGILSIILIITAAVHNIAESSMISLNGILSAAILFLVLSLSSVRENKNSHIDLTLNGRDEHRANGIHPRK